GWLRARGVNLQTGVFVQDVGFAASPGRINVNRLDYERNGAANSVAVASDDLVLLTFGSQAADLSLRSMSQAPPQPRTGRASALWKRLAQGRPEFGNPDAFYGPGHVRDSRWVTFTITSTGTDFLELMTALTGSETGRGGLVSLIDSPWLLSLSVFHQPEIMWQPPGPCVLWGYRFPSDRTCRFC